MRAPHAYAAVFALTCAVCGCGGTMPAPQRAADAVTKAVYDDDVNAVQSQFDANLQKAVTLGSVASLSRQLHALGTYAGLTGTVADASTGRYDYSATFGTTAVAVHLRLDGDGRIAAYRLDVPRNVSART